MDEFKVIGCIFSEESSTQHHIFAKEHSIRNNTPDKPQGKTLFLLNVPPYATQKSLKRVFSSVGPVKNVFLHKDVKHTQENNNNLLGYKIAYIVFEKSSDLRKALELKIIGPFSTQQHPIILGLQKYIKEYNESVVDRRKLSIHCTEAINKYDKEQEKAKREQQTTDDEGWTVVTSKGRHSGVARTEANINKLNNKKMKGLQNFYSFQIKENKMKEISELRKKYEEDKKRIEMIKKTRKFKPY